MTTCEPPVRHRTDGLPLLLGAALLFQGAGHAAGLDRIWFVIDHLDFLRGHETLASVALAVTGLIVLATR